MAAEEVVAAATGAAVGGTITVATVTSTVPAAGIAGWLGFTTTATTVVAVPVAGIVAVGALLGYGLYKGIKYCIKKEEK